MCECPAYHMIINGCKRKKFKNLEIGTGHIEYQEA